MNVFGKYFEYDGVSSDVYDVILCSFEEVNNTRETGINYELNIGDISPLRPIANFYSKRYSKPLEFKITLAKDGYNTNDFFTDKEQQKIIRWLTSSTDYRKFRIKDYDGSYYHDGIEYFCICIGYEETVINDSIAGMSFSFQCNAPYGFYQEDVTKFQVTDSKTIVIDNYSDEREMAYYPYIEITGTKTGNVIFHNDRLPDNDMELHILNNQTLYIDNKLCDITDNMDMFDYSSDTNLKWLSLLPGKNQLTITGSVNGQVKCRYPRKVGI